MSDGDAAAVANSFTTAAEALQHATVPARVSELVMLRAQIKANDEKLFAAQYYIDAAQAVFAENEAKLIAAKNLNDASQAVIAAQASMLDQVARGVLTPPRVSS